MVVLMTLNKSIENTYDPNFLEWFFSVQSEDEYIRVMQQQVKHKITLQKYLTSKKGKEYTRKKSNCAYRKLKNDPVKYEEHLKKARGYNREYYKRLKNDPVKYERYLQRNRGNRTKMKIADVKEGDK